MRPIGRLIDADHLIDVFAAADGPMFARIFSRAVKLAGQRAIENVVHQGRLPRAGDARHHRHHAQREADVQVLQVVLVRPEDGNGRAVRLPALVAHADPAASADVLAGQRLGLVGNLAGSAGGNHFASVPAGAGSQVDDVIGAPNRLLVVLHHQHGIAQVAQRFERLQQAGIVAVVQPDRRLVQHVEHAAQLGADLRGQPYALPFAAGERGRRTIQRHIPQANVVQKTKPLADFAEHAAGDLVLAVVKANGARRFYGPRNRKRRELGDGHAVDLHG